jgi:GT2 family glycosyltransferase/Tfp pilus assembly protein PilF
MNGDVQHSEARVLAAVVTFSAPEHLHRCLNALAAQDRPPERVLVIDNCGHPPVPADLSVGSLDIEVHRTDRNLGPAGAFALAVDLFLTSGFDAVWLMDDDVAPEQTCLRVLLEAVAREDRAIALPLVDPDGDTSRRFEGWGWYGALIPRTVAETQGGPRADFVWWLEDTEYLQHRLPASGVRVLRPAAVVAVASARATARKPAWKYFYESRNLTYVHAHWMHGRRTPDLLAALARSVIRIARSEDERARKLLVLARGVYDGVRGRLGLTFPLEAPHRPTAAHGPVPPARSDEDQAAAWLEQAAAKAASGEPARAAEFARRAAELLPAGHEDRHDTFAQAADLFAAASRHRAAADSWAEAAASAPDDAQRAIDLINSASAAREAGAWTEAEATGRQALELAEQATGPGSRTTADAANRLAMVCKYTGRFDDAEKLYRRALAVAEAQGDADFLASICHNLGGLAHARGAYAEGEPWARRAVRIREDAEVGEVVTLAKDRGALAAILVGLGKHEEAGDLLRRCRDDFGAALGFDHYEVGVAEGNLAALALALGELVAAEQHARRALAIKHAALGEAHPELATTLTTLGVVRRRAGDRAEAEALHRRALAVLEPAVDRTHPLLRTIRRNLASAQDAS